MLATAGVFVLVYCHKDYHLSDNNSITKKFTIDNDGNTTGETDTSNVQNVREMFPLVEAFAILLGVVLTAKQLKLTREQQRRSDDWKRTEFVTNEIRIFSCDRSVINFKALLEGIDAEYEPRLLFDIPDVKGDLKRRELAVSKQELLNGLTPDPGPFKNVHTGKEIPPEQKKSQTPVENKIAYTVDEFLIYIINLQKLVNNDVLTIADLYPHLNHWFRLIMGSDEASEDDRTRFQAHLIRSALHDYITSYFYREWEFMKILIHSKEKYRQPKYELNEIALLTKSLRRRKGMTDKKLVHVVKKFKSNWPRKPLKRVYAQDQLNDLCDRLSSAGPLE